MFVRKGARTIPVAAAVTPGTATSMAMDTVPIVALVIPTVRAAIVTHRTRAWQSGILQPTGPLSYALMHRCGKTTLAELLLPRRDVASRSWLSITASKLLDTPTWTLVVTMKIIAAAMTAVVETTSKETKALGVEKDTGLSEINGQRIGG